MTYEPVSLESLLSHQSWAMRLARRLVREEGEAEDLLQHTWIAALRHPPGNERGARAWLRKVILNLARERYRREQTRARHELAGSSETRSAPDAFELTSQKEISGLLGRELLGLQEPYRSVLVQRFYDGLSSAEISRRSGVPSGTVRWRLKIGLDLLREELDRRSHGDRSRWVSALLVFAPRELGPGADPGEDPSTPAELAEASRRTQGPAGVAGVLSGSIWIGLSAALVLGGYLALRPRAVSAAEVAAPALAVREPTPVGTLAQVGREREPLASLPSAHEPPAGEAATGLRIRVVDDEGRPTESARILVAKTSGFETRTRSDGEGQARIDVRAQDVNALDLPISRGRVGLRALSDGRAASKVVFVAPPFTEEQEVRLEVGGPEVTFVGRVLDEEGESVAGAEVAWMDILGLSDTRPEHDYSSTWFLSTRSDAEGRFQLRNLAAGDGRLLCFARGFALSLVATSDIADPLDVSLRLTRGATVRGRVRGPDGRGAAGITVRCETRCRAGDRATGLLGYDASVRGFEESTRTDENGDFELAAVGTGTRKLWALDPERELAASVTLELDDGQESRWDPELGDLPKLRLALVDLEQRPLAGWIAHVRRPTDAARWWVRRFTADAEGRVVILDCPDEEVFVDVFQPSGNGASFASGRFSARDEELRIEVDTAARSSVWGVLLDGSGAPETVGRLKFFALLTGLTTSVERDANGSFSQQLAPGPYLLIHHRDQGAAILARVALGSGEVRDLGTLSAPPMGTLRLDGAALQSGSERLPSYVVHAPLTARGVLRYFQATRGVLETETLLSLHAGRYRLVAYDGADSPAVEHEVEVLPFAETKLRLVR